MGPLPKAMMGDEGSGIFLTVNRGHVYHEVTNPTLYNELHSINMDVGWVVARPI